MFCNEGKFERILRVLLGATFIVVSFMKDYSMIIKNFLIIFGVILVLTGFVGFCPLYKVMGINSCRIWRFNRITKKDIEEAIKNHPVNTEIKREPEVKIISSPTTQSLISEPNIQVESKKKKPKKATTKKKKKSKKTKSSKDSKKKSKKNTK